MYLSQFLELNCWPHFLSMMETVIDVLMDRRMSIVTAEFCTLVSVNSRKMMTRLGEVLRLSNARISFIGHCDQFFEEKEKALYVWLSFGNGGCHGTIQGGVSGHAGGGKPIIDPTFLHQAHLPSTMHTAIETPLQLSAMNRYHPTKQHRCFHIY